MTDFAPIQPIGTTTPTQQRILKEGEDHNDLGTDTFLKLLVAQLKYQDPTNPSDSTQFLAQTAQFTMVEKITQLTELAQKSSEADKNLAAASLVGRNIKYLDAHGGVAEGQVSSARLGSEGPILMVGGWEVEFDRVYEVTSPQVVSGPVPAPRTSPPAAAPVETTKPPAAAVVDPAPTPTVVSSPVVRTPVVESDERAPLGNPSIPLVRPEDAIPLADQPRRLLDVDAS